MRNIYRLASIAAVSLGLNACTNDTGEQQALDSLQQKASYSYGVDVANRLKQQGIELDVQALNRGIADAYSGAELALPDEERLQAKTSFQAELRDALVKKQAEASAANLEAGKAFLEENAKKPGVITTDSGLQYKVITSGDGKQPKDTDTVTTHYRGTLIDGREFDSSYKRGEPATFPVNGLIKGWQEALTLMPSGSTWMLYVPSDLAYGARGAGPIGPNETLIFKIQVHEVVR